MYMGHEKLSTKNREPNLCVIFRSLSEILGAFLFFSWMPTFNRQISWDAPFPHGFGERMCRKPKFLLQFLSSPSNNKKNYYFYVIQVEVVTLNKILGSIFLENMMKHRELLSHLF